VNVPYIIGHLYAKNYHIWLRFDEVLTKTSLDIFLYHPVVDIWAPAFGHNHFGA